MEKHPNLRQVYEDFGGYDGIMKVAEYINIENLSSYINELRKWGKIKRLAELGYPVNNRLSEFEDKTLEEIYEAINNTNIFEQVD